jgi:rubrerythrin
MTEHEETKVIAEYDHETEALAAQAALEAAGIKAVVSAGTNTMLDAKQVQLAVPVTQVEEAQAILAHADSPPEAGWEATAEGAIDGWLCHNCDTVVSKDEVACPACGALRSEQPPEDGGRE